jgi:DNA-binding LacI/PurR family transcriptional regulator
MHISIKDVAKAASVSNSTVSRAPSDSLLVEAEIKARIQRLAHSPNASARSLVAKSTRTWVSLLPSITASFVAGIPFDLALVLPGNGHLDDGEQALRTLAGFAVLDDQANLQSQIMRGGS